MPLTITIHRTDVDHHRAEIVGHHHLVIERDELSEFVEELKQTLDSLMETPDGGSWIARAKETVDINDAAARAALKESALRNADLDDLIERYPVPSGWGEEPGWLDAV